jgi:hypothetical protein
MAELEGKPAKEVVAIVRHRDSRKTADDKDFETRVPYIRRQDTQTKFHYEKKLDRRPWQEESRLIAIEIEKPDKTTMRFDLAPQGTGQYRSFVSADGWVLMEIPGDGPIKGPSKFSFGKLILTLFFNAAHLAGWFIGLWLLLRFQWTHALGFAVVLWLVFTLVVLPMMLSYAGLVAANRQTPTAWLWNATVLG